MNNFTKERMTMKKPLMFVLVALLGSMVFGKAAYAIAPGDEIYNDHRTTMTFSDELGDAFIGSVGSLYVPMDGLYNVSLMDAKMGHPEYTGFDYLDFSITDAFSPFDTFASVSVGKDYATTMADGTFYLDQGLYDVSVDGGVFGSTPTSMLTVGYGASIALVPEMETWIMLIAGMGIIAFVLRRRVSAQPSLSFA